MKILLTGSGGQLGIELIKQFDKEIKFNINKTYAHNLDITNHSLVIEYVNTLKPDVIINCAAFTNVDECESDEIAAFRVNAIGAQNLSVAAFNVNAKFVQLSTDYVFDGFENEFKKEYHSVNPQNIYGKTKVLAESLVRATNPRHFIVRTAWLFGEGNNFVRTMLNLAASKKEIKVVSDQFGTPTSTKELSKCIINLIKTESYGTYHATCEGYCSWYEFAKKIFELASIDINIKKISSEELERPAKRPRYSVLENHMLNLINLNTFCNWEDALKEYLKGEI